MKLGCHRVALFSLPTVLLLGATTALALDASSGNAQKIQYGKSVATADMNGDGVKDLVVGAPMEDVTTVVDGKTVTLKHAGSITIISGLGGIQKIFYGKVADQQFGSVFAIYPDADGDGIPDLIIGNPLADPVIDDGMHGPQVFKDAGNVSLYSGGTGLLIRSIADGGSRGEQFGSAVAVSDIGELAVGAPYFDMSMYDTKLHRWPNAGRVYIFDDISGPSPWWYEKVSSQLQKNAYFGSAVTWVDGNLVVGSPGFDVQSPVKIVDAGMVEMFDYNTGDVVANPTGSAKGDRLGSALTSFQQDIDGDAATDWATGAPAADAVDVISGKTLKDAGKVFVYSGFTSTASRVLSGSAAGDFYGAALDAGADFGNGGTNDLVIGAPKADASVLLDSKPVVLKDAGTVEILSGESL